MANVEQIAETLDFSQLPDGVFHSLIDALETIEDQRQKVTPTESFSEHQHVADQMDDILERLSDVRDILAKIVGEEMAHRRHVNPPARSAGRVNRSADDEE